MNMTGDIRTVSLEAKDWTGVDAIIDLAGLSNDATCEIDPWLTQSINLEGGKRLATLAKQSGVKKYIYSSSASVYGNNPDENLTEAAELRPLTAYAECKAEVEDHIRSLASDGFEPVILRNGTVYGVAPRMRFDLAVNVMTMRAWKDGLIYVMGGGEQWRPFVHVHDVVQAFVASVEGDKSGTFNIASTNGTIKWLAGAVKGRFPEVKIHHIPDDLDKRSYHISSELARTQLGWNPTQQISYGIKQVSEALMTGYIRADDPTTHTLNYYKSLIEWDRRLADLKLDGVLL